jgi:putative membrane protein
MSFAKNIIVALKGFAMGAANVVPGVSGGTLALITGIYGEIIDALNALMSVSAWKMFFHGRFREFWRFIHGNFMLALLIGVVISIFSLAKLMGFVMLHYPVQTWAFFFGLIVASAVYMLFDIKGWNIQAVLLTIVGVVIGVVICTLSPATTPDDLWFIAICGAIAICTMILPGISGSFILVILGKYQYIMDAVANLNWPVLIVFGIGCIVGILAFAKFLHWLLKHYEKGTMLVLTGFIIGSLIKVWPWNDMEAVAKAEFLGAGASVEQAEIMAGNLATQVAAGSSWGNFGIDLHTGAAVIWAIIGMFVVWSLETLSAKKVR